MNLALISGTVLWLACLAHAPEPALQVMKLTGPTRLLPGEQIAGTVVLAQPAAADQTVVVQWRDTYDRLGDQARLTLPAGQDRLTYTLHLTDPIARRGRVEVLVDETLQMQNLPFDVVLPPPAWSDYIAFVWASYPHGYYDLLRDYGINGGMLYRDRDGDHYDDNNFPVYIDQMGWEVFSWYHKRRSEWEMVMQGYERDPRDSALTMRRYCLADEASFLKLRENYGQIVSKQRDCRPLFYNLADEIGLGDQSGANDFCWDYPSRDGFRDFLMHAYGSLERLNAEWQTNYSSWGAVRAFQPTTYSQYDKLHREVYLPRDFQAPDSQKCVETFGSAFPSFDNVVGLYADLRTGDPVDADYIKKRYAPRPDRADEQAILQTINRTFGCAFQSLADVATFYAAYDRWSFGLSINRDRADDLAGWNLAPWMDFREYMDTQMADAMARAVAIGKEFDPDGRFGFTGTHHPGVFSGHNYAKLCPVVGLIVPYNIGDTPEIIRSLNPDTCYQILPSWRTGDDGVRDIWTRLLHGDRGIIFWDNDEPRNRFLTQPDKKPTERALSLGPTLVEIESGIARQLLACRRENYGLALYYSHPSIRVDYWREYLGQGRRWVELRSWHLYRQSLRNLLRDSWCRLIEDLNLQYDMVSAEQVRQGRLLQNHYKVLILPEVFALSEAEADAIRQFVAAGGVVIADRFCGLMDEHGKWLERPRLAELWANPNAHLLDQSFESYARLRMSPGKETALRDAVGQLLAAAGIKPAVRVLSGKTNAPLAAAEVHVFDAAGGVRLAGITRSIELRQEGIGGAARVDNSIFEQTEPVVLQFDRPVQLYDQRAGKDLGRQESFSLNLDSWSPPILVLADEALTPIGAGLTQSARVVHVSLHGYPPVITRVSMTPAGRRIIVQLQSQPPQLNRAVRIEVRDPAGQLLRHYSGNALIRGGTGQWMIPMAISDPDGSYQITCRDVLTGQTVVLEARPGPPA
jgi:hypothetical protein